MQRLQYHRWSGVNHKSCKKIRNRYQTWLDLDQNDVSKEKQKNSNIQLHFTDWTETGFNLDIKLQWGGLYNKWWSHMKICVWWNNGVYVCVCDDETESCGQTWGTAHKTETVDLYLNFRQRNCPTVNQSYLFLLNTINAIFCIPNKNRKYFITFLCRKAFWTVYYMGPMFRVFFHKLAESLSLPSACPCLCSDAHIQCFLYDWDKDFVTVTPISFRCCS